MKELPESLFEINSIKDLELGGNNLMIISESLSNLQNLEILYLNSNGLIEIPSSVYELMNLKELHIGRNPIKQIDKKVGNLQNLEQLWIERTEIENIPNELTLLKSLNFASIGYNKLKDVNTEFHLLPNLKDIQVYGKLNTDIIRKLSSNENVISVGLWEKFYSEKEKEELQNEKIKFYKM